MSNVTYLTSRICCPYNFYELNQMAKTLMILLQIPEGSEISLILGQTVDKPNQESIALWVREYIESHPNQHDFKDDIYPEFIRHLNRCQQDLLAEAEWQLQLG